MYLESELATFKKELPNLLAVPGNRGKFVLIHGTTVDSVWDKKDDAIGAGYDRFGLFEPFLIQEITDTPRVYFCSRQPAPWPSGPARSVRKGHAVRFAAGGVAVLYGSSG